MKKNRRIKLRKNAQKFKLKGKNVQRKRWKWREKNLRKWEKNLRSKIAENGQKWGNIKNKLKNKMKIVLKK